jgi:hypothetical protein
MMKEFYAAVIVVFAIFIAIAIGIYGQARNEDRLIAQCLADGRKEYECVSIVQGGRSPSPVVVPMPVVIGR